MNINSLINEYEKRKEQARESVSLISRPRALAQAASSVVEWMESLSEADNQVLIDYLEGRMKALNKQRLQGY